MPHRDRRSAVTQAQALIAIFMAGLGLILFSSLTLKRHKGPADIAAEARAYLKQRGVEPLEADWKKAGNAKPAESLPHPLMGRAAPDFTLPGADGATVSLRERLKDGPILLVFYYGYYCNHCVAQLFALEADLAKFRSAGAQVIAISPDLPEETREKFAKYGSFSFPALADDNNRAAADYSLVVKRTGTSRERLLHGTFIIDQGGVVRWCHFGEAPFTDSASLLHRLHDLVGNR